MKTSHHIYETANKEWSICEWIEILQILPVSEEDHHIFVLVLFV